MINIRNIYMSFHIALTDTVAGRQFCRSLVKAPLRDCELLAKTSIPFASSVRFVTSASLVFIMLWWWIS